MVIRTLSLLILILAAGTQVCAAQTASLILEIPAAVGIVRITAERRHSPKSVEQLCSTELAPLVRAAALHKVWWLAVLAVVITANTAAEPS